MIPNSSIVRVVVRPPVVGNRKKKRKLSARPDLSPVAVRRRKNLPS